MPKRKIALVMQDLLHADGIGFTGGDRYARDLARLCREIGVEPVIFQKAYPVPTAEKQVLLDRHKWITENLSGAGEESAKLAAEASALESRLSRMPDKPKYFEAEYEGTHVFALPSEKPFRLNLDSAQNMQEYKAHVYFTMGLAYPRVLPRSVAISHGIWFDHPEMPPQVTDEQFHRMLETTIGALDCVVSVDTNTINHFGALFYGRYHHKFRHIPNYADLDHFKPREKPKTGNTVVLYPRRLEVLRGYIEMRRIAEELLPKYKHAEFHFCGRAHSSNIEESLQVKAADTDRLHWYAKPFDEMPAVYRGADFAVIPTMGCEGTSFSAIEAQACGIPLVSTYVGGLSELVIDGYNGLKVAPRYEDIRDAVDWMIRHPADRERMGKNARAVAEQFSLAKWKKAWGEVIHDLVR